MSKRDKRKAEQAREVRAGCASAALSRKEKGRRVIYTRTGLRRDKPIERADEVLFYSASGSIPAYAIGAPRMGAESLMAVSGNAALGLHTTVSAGAKLVSLVGDCWVNVLSLWDHLGDYMEVRYRGTVAMIRLPSVSDVIKALETMRKVSYRMLRNWFDDDPERLYQFLDQAIPQVPGRSKPDPGRLTRALPTAQIVMANLMLVYVRSRYRVFPQPDTGWKWGRIVENGFMLNTLPPRSEWHPDTVVWMDKFFVPVTEFGGFCLPSIGEGDSSVGGDGPQPPRPSTPVRLDPERILFSMSLASYEELRFLSGRNPNEYVAVVFSSDPKRNQPRVGLDSAWTGNRFFGLCGPLADCLVLAQNTKREIGGNPLCVAKFVHDPSGEWKVSLRAWLGC